MATLHNEPTPVNSGATVNPVESNTLTTSSPLKKLVTSKPAKDTHHPKLKMENADAALKSRARSASYSTSPLLRKWSFLDGVVVAKWWWSLPWEVLVVGVIKKDWHVLGRMRCRRDSFAIDWNMFLVVLLDWCLTAGQVS